MTDLITVEGGRHADDVGGFASASITDASGRLVAVCTQHGRWLKGAPAGGPARTASVHVAYPRPVPAGARVRSAAQAGHLGRAFGVVRVTAHDDDSGKPFAIATVTMSP